MNLVYNWAITMDKIIGVTELQRRFRSVFDDVAKRGIPYVLTRGSRPEAVLIPYAEYVRIKEIQEGEILERFDGLIERMAAQNEQFGEDEVEADLRAARARG